MLALLAPSHVLEPHEKREIVFEIFGADTAIGPKKSTNVHMHGVDVLEMLVIPDLGFVLMENVHGVGCEKHIVVVVGIEVSSGDLDSSCRR